MNLKDLYTHIVNKLIGYKHIINQPTIKVELLVEVSFNTFVQVCYTDETGRYRINEFTGLNWKKVLLFSENKELLFKVFVNNHFLKSDQWVLLRKTTNDDEVIESKFYLNNNLLYEGWFQIT